MRLYREEMLRQSQVQSYQVRPPLTDLSLASLSYSDQGSQDNLFIEIGQYHGYKILKILQRMIMLSGHSGCIFLLSMQKSCSSTQTEVIS